jgi:hypothetical protein
LNGFAIGPVLEQALDTQVPAENNTWPNSARSGSSVSCSARRMLHPALSQALAAALIEERQRAVACRRTIRLSRRMARGDRASEIGQFHLESWHAQNFG